MRRKLNLFPDAPTKTVNRPSSRKISEYTPDLKNGLPQTLKSNSLLLPRPSLVVGPSTENALCSKRKLIQRSRNPTLSLSSNPQLSTTTASAAAVGLLGIAGYIDEDRPGIVQVEDYDRHVSARHKYSIVVKQITNYIKIISPHIGLVLLLLGYTVFGAALFHLIEQPHELQSRKETLQRIWLAHDDIVRQLWNESRTTNATSFRERSEELLFDMEEILFSAYQTGYVSHVDIRNNTDTVWTFPASIFFATTVITTIGYGNMAPQTFYGRLFCIIFGLFGIPLLLITIADIGKFLSDFITFIYKKYRNAKRVVKNQSKVLNKFTKTADSHVSDGGHRQATVSAASFNSLAEDEVHIPVWMVLLFLTCYTALGGYLFKTLEGWAFFEAFYFCFITMATIGFGDVVPTKQMYMFITMIYIVIGLAITTMCIDLAGTEYIRKIHYFGTKIDTAKDAMAQGLHVGQDLMEQMKSAVADGRLPLDVKALSLLGKPLGQIEDMSDELLYQLYPDLLNKDKEAAFRNILWEPLSPAVQKLLKPNIKVLPDEIGDDDATVVENKVFDQPLFGPDGLLAKRLQHDMTVRCDKIKNAQIAALRAMQKSVSNGNKSREERNTDDKASDETLQDGVYELPPIIAPFLMEETDC